MLTETDLRRLSEVLDRKLNEQLNPIRADLRQVRMKVDQMWDALEKHGLPLVAAD